jgi:hypothetical protein
VNIRIVPHGIAQIFQNGFHRMVDGAAGADVDANAAGADVDANARPMSPTLGPGLGTNGPAQSQERSLFDEGAPGPNQNCVPLAGRQSSRPPALEQRPLSRRNGTYYKMHYNLAGSRRRSLTAGHRSARGTPLAIRNAGTCI